MKSENLVILKGDKPVTFETDILKPNIFYRCIDIGEQEFMVYGIVFSAKKFMELFEYAHTRILRDFKTLGILGENDKPISKSLFTKLADIHDFGRGRNKLKVWYFMKSTSLIYGFYPMQGTKAENQNECYQWYLDIINGNMESIDDKDVMFGNCGIPLSYKGLRVS